jgi:hypothetical protein
MYPRKMLADFLGDRVIYRNLSPCDPTLPTLADIWPELSSDMLRVPRKTEPIYGAAAYHFLQEAQARRGLPPLKWLLFVGDSPLTDATSARHLGEYLPMRGFIGQDKLTEEKRINLEGSLMFANRWQALTDFLEWARADSFAFNQQTALVLDLDKTSFGARGRNDKIIDQARVTALRQIVESVLGDTFNPLTLDQVYHHLYQSQYHPFTRDNQDYLAYITLMVLSQIYPAERLYTDLDNGRLTGIYQFVALCDARQPEMSAELLHVHREVTGYMSKNDPTPFKSFRVREYQATVALMDVLPDDAPQADILAHEITLTGEVVEFAEQLAAQGVLTFGLSDKPDEASIPSPEAATQGALPLHRIKMKMVGTLYSA